MKTFNFLILSALLVFQTTSIFSQKTESINDTTFAYVLNKAERLFKPESELNLTLTLEDLINKKPDINKKPIELADTAKYFKELKGDYKDWKVFYKIGSVYSHFNNNQTAYSYYEQAYNLIQKEIFKDSLNSKYYSEIGKLLLKINDTENALYAFNKAYDLNNNDSVATCNLSMLLLNLGQYQKVEEILQKCIENKNSELNYCYLSFFLTLYKEQTNNYNTTARNSIDEVFDFEKIKELTVKNYNDIRYIVLQLYCRQLAIFRNNFEVFMEQSIINKIDSKESKKIKKAVAELISDNKFKNKKILYRTLALNALLNKEFSNAIKMFEKAIENTEFDNRDEDYYNIYYTKLALQKDTLAALNLIDEKLEYDSIYNQQNILAYTTKGNIYLQMKKYDSALVNYQKTLKYAPVPTAMLGIAYLLIREKRFDEAISYINNAYNTNQEYYLTYAFNGIYNLLNNYKIDAKSSIDKAMVLAPNNETLKEINAAFFAN